jgi:hypothetical protein
LPGCASIFSGAGRLRLVIGYRRKDLESLVR